MKRLSHPPFEALESLTEFGSFKTPKWRKFKSHQGPESLRATPDQIGGLQRKVNRAPGVGRQTEVLLHFQVAPLHSLGFAIYMSDVEVP